MLEVNPLRCALFRTQWASFEANPQSARLVFKSSLILSDKSLRIVSPLSHTS
ncbi:hypothetical protein ACFQHW_08970 [Lapidilactobacillus achengensis]|uniref:Uncharacterized protein n=1 Tax=Lapidilactobacillus achengensis TaxID=2486000 RepID=A0ABW1UNZ9_9LACO